MVEESQAFQVLVNRLNVAFVEAASNTLITKTYVDYKDIETMQRLLTNRGKIYGRKRSGNCAGCQRKVKRAIKRARYMSLLPFTA
ncbi:MAG: 30S ribosomal protein S18 [Planctomycetota bacterium]|jgi:ribosomal protein S18